MHLPLGVFGVAVATVSLPELSSLAAVGKKDLLLARYIRSCKMQLSFLLPSALFLIVAARPICALIYQHGVFGWEDSVNAAYALQAYCAGLIFFGLVRLSAQVFYAYKNTATPVKIAVLAMVINIILMLILMRPMGFAGLALAPGIAALANFLMLTHTIRKKVGRPGYKSLVWHMVKTAIAALAGAAVIYIILSYFDVYSGYAGIFATAIRLAIGFIGGLLVFGVLGLGFGIFKRKVE
jgi:putative peptidoglycan lipid II flippase